MHPILRRQLRKLGLAPEEAPDPARWAQFLARVEASYHSSDLDRYTLERSLSLSSEEMRELTLRLQRALEQLNRISMTDELTGLMNRRYLNLTIQEEVAQAVRSHRHLQGGSRERLLANVDLAFLMADLDHFKEVNDTYGHAAGDLVLVQVTRILGEACRGTDTVIRWGGEEFLILARNLSRADLGTLCERIRQRVAAHPFEIGPQGPLHLTCSIGGAVYPFLEQSPQALPWERILEACDTCLYAAKHSGRNAWVWVTPTPLATPQDFETGVGMARLIQSGHLEAHASLPAGTPIAWQK